MAKKPQKSLSPPPAPPLEVSVSDTVQVTDSASWSIDRFIEPIDTRIQNYFNRLRPRWRLAWVVFTVVVTSLTFHFQIWPQLYHSFVPVDIRVIHRPKPHWSIAIHSTASFAVMIQNHSSVPSEPVRITLEYSSALREPSISPYLEEVDPSEFIIPAIPANSISAPYDIQFEPLRVGRDSLLVRFYSPADTVECRDPQYIVFVTRDIRIH